MKKLNRIFIIFILIFIAGCESGPGEKTGEVPVNLPELPIVNLPEVPDIEIHEPAQLNSFTVGKSHSCAIGNAGEVKCWGLNNDEQLGHNEGNKGDSPDSMGTELPAVNFVDDSKVSGVYAGAKHTCAIFTTGKVACWGDNTHNQLGYVGPTSLENPLPINFGGGRTAKSLSMGIDFTCALLDNNQVKCWGANDSRQLGGDEFTENTPDQDYNIYFGEGKTVKKIFSGADSKSSCAILNDDSLTCWGSNNKGILGSGHDYEDGKPGEFYVDFGDDYAVDISIFKWHACAILNTNEVKCWGAHNDGTLGIDGNGYPIYNSPMGAVKFDSSEPGESKAKKITVGDEHSCVITESDEVKCWGHDGWASEGVLGIGSSQICIGGSLNNDCVSITTLQDTYKVDLGDFIPKEIIGGNEFTCAKSETDAIKCWGGNWNGQLGLGHTDDKGGRDDADLTKSSLEIDLGFE